MKILYIAAESMPLASSGGLGDVIGSLPSALNHLDGNDVRVIMPLHGIIADKYRKDFEFLGSKTVKLSWREQYCGIFKYCLNGVVYYFIDNEYYFKRDKLYGEFDDGERYAFFCRAALEILPEIDFFPDILHAHDWHAALGVIYLKRCYAVIDERYKNIKSVFTIHNIQYQGTYGFELLGDVFALMSFDKDTVDHGGCINLLKGAVECADAVTTVSPSYAKEILTPEYSFGLDPELNECAEKLYGILNGIDTVYYNPAKDKEIKSNFSYRNISGKRECKRALLAECGLPQSDSPVLAVISRLAGHKGLDLLMLCADEILQNDVKLVVLGTGERGYEDFFRSLEQKYPDKCRAFITYDRDLSKRIYAGADIFIMPSKTEPCGLAQMISSRYGTVPVVHETGGLRDSIKDVLIGEKGNGFTFSAYSAYDLKTAVLRALNMYYEKEGFEKLRIKVMRVDFSWKKSAKAYNKLYEKIISR